LSPLGLAAEDAALQHFENNDTPLGDDVKA